MHSCQVSFGLVAADCWSVVVTLATKLRNEAFWLFRYVGSSVKLVEPLCLVLTVYDYLTCCALMSGEFWTCSGRLSVRRGVSCDEAAKGSLLAAMVRRLE